jgi:hypothetical protein
VIARRSQRTSRISRAGARARQSQSWIALIGGGALGSLMLGALACAGQGDALARGQRYYEDNQYERALALWRDLDRRQAAFAPAERTRYAYFRGMTDYRLGYRDDARHWLAIAKARDQAGGGVLGATWQERLEVALSDLEREAFGTRPRGSDVVQTIELPPSSASFANEPDAGGGPNSSEDPAAGGPR